MTTPREDAEPPRSQQSGAYTTGRKRAPRGMTTPREDAIAALSFLSDRYGHTVEDDGEDNWMRFAAIEAALGAAAETPRPPSVRESSERLGIVTDPVSQRSFIVKPPPFEDDAGHWVDLASPETAEALARALANTNDGGSDEWWEFPATRMSVDRILAAMQETGR